MSAHDCVAFVTGLICGAKCREQVCHLMAWFKDTCFHEPCWHDIRVADGAIVITRASVTHDIQKNKDNCEVVLDWYFVVLLNVMFFFCVVFSFFVVGCGFCLGLEWCMLRFLWNDVVIVVSYVCVVCCHITYTTHATTHTQLTQQHTHTQLAAFTTQKSRAGAVRHASGTMWARAASVMMTRIT